MKKIIKEAREMYRKSVEKDCRAIYDLICDMEQKELPYGAFTKIYPHQL